MATRTIRIYAKNNCDTCGGTGYVTSPKGIDTGVRLPCDCVTSQIPIKSPDETDYMIMPALYQNQVPNANDQ